MINIIFAIVALGILITVHEGGHYLAAVLFGVKVEKFSIGFGPKLYSFHKFNTEFCISLIPLGGYVKMKGENPDEDVSGDDSYQEKAWWKRAVIAFSGPFMNFLFAILVFILSFAVGRTYEDNLPVIGKMEEPFKQLKVNDRILAVNNNEILGWSQIIKHTQKNEDNSYKIERDGQIRRVQISDIDPQDWTSSILPLTPARIGEVAPGLPAYKAGLMEDDQIISINDKPVDDWYEMREAIKTSEKNTVRLVVKRDKRTFDKEIELETNIIDDSRIIGITQYLPVKSEEKYNMIESVGYGMITTVNFVAVNYSMLYKLIAHPEAIKANLGGPVMIYTMSQQSAKKGLYSILTFIAAISIILMIMNLLPIPILDGGHIFFCVIEGIQRKPLSRKVQIALQNIGIVLLLFLMLFAFWNDLSRIFTRNLSIKQQQSESRIN